MPQKHQFKVEMTCGGCSGAVQKVLSKLEGVEFNIELENKMVYVTTDKSSEEILAVLKKTGKETSYVGTA